jgi:hypothetical protein
MMKKYGYLVMVVIALAVTGTFTIGCGAGGGGGQVEVNVPPTPTPTPTCTAGDVDKDGICDDVDPCIGGDTNGDGFCDAQETKVDVCYSTTLEIHVQQAYGDPNDSTGQWQQFHDVPLDADGCATFYVPKGTPKPIMWVFYDCTYRAMSDPDFNPDTDWCNEELPPHYIVVGDLSSVDYTADDYYGKDGVGWGYPACMLGANNCTPLP